MKQKPWTRQEINLLREGIGTFGVNWFLKKIGKTRSKGAIYLKARRLFGFGGLTRSAYTLRKIQLKTGYSTSQIQRAMRALGQRWNRTSKIGNYLISEDQLCEILDWLRYDYWSRKHRLYNCVWCGNSKREHYSKGLCLKCYHKYHRFLVKHNWPVSNKEFMKLLPNEKDGTVNEVKKQLKKGLALTQDLLWELKGCDFVRSSTK